MDIRPMLVRLQGALNRYDLIDKMLLLPGLAPKPLGWEQNLDATHLVVGYNTSPGSQTALDLTLWIAHQTRLVTRKLVTVQVVYVVEHQDQHSQRMHPAAIEQADRVLWQARSLAEEWRDVLKTHLRVGNVATELAKVVQAEAASVLLLGCQTPEHPLVRQLGPQFPCPVVGIPPQLGGEEAVPEVTKPRNVGILTPR